MTKAVGYLRVSSQGQVRDGYSLAYQRDEIIRYCTDNGIDITHIYEDKGISGAKVDEDGLTVERKSCNLCSPTLHLSQSTALSF